MSDLRSPQPDQPDPDQPDPDQPEQSDQPHHLEEFDGPGKRPSRPFVLPAVAIAILLALAVMLVIALVRN